MIRPLFAKAWNDSKWLLAGMAALLFLFPWLNIWVTSMVSLPAFSEFLTNFVPKQWERIAGVSFSVMATPAGRIALIYAHPIIVFGSPAWAIARGSDCVSGEIGRGTMEMLLAQPVRRMTIYATQAAMTILGSALLAFAVWAGIAMGLATISLPDHVPASLFIAPSLNVFALLVWIGGLTALVSACDSQRWRTVGIVCAWYAISTLMTVMSRAVNNWQWVSYASFLRAYRPQAMVANPEKAWSLLEYQDGALVGLGLGAQHLILISMGLLCYLAGAIIFSRREIPAPL